VTKVVAPGVVAPGLDELLVSENPAWLWDGERVRIVWANSAGTSWFGAETLFDLLDVVFDETEPGVARIKELTRILPRGEKASASFQFSAASGDQPLACECYVHALADGRSGLLVCARAADAPKNALPLAVQAMALGAFPLPVCVVSGTGRVMFANQALQEIWPDNTGFQFADSLIEQSFKAGLLSGFKSVTTRHGKRDIKVIVRPLEKAERLVDSNFLLVLEDITERRALERSLLEAATHNSDSTEQTDQALAKSAVPAPVDPPVENEVAVALDALRQEIQKQVPARPQESKLQEQAEQETASNDDNDDDGIGVPEIVSATLNNLPQPLVLVDQSGHLLFANDVAVELMAVENWQAIDKITTLGDALAALEGEDGSISLFTAKDEPLSLDVIMSSFPWKDGPVFQATLSPGSDGEEADNRRAAGLKKNSEKAAPEKNRERQQEEEKITSQPLLAVSDNVVSLHADRSARNPSDDELRAILDTATDGIVTLDSKGKICSFSAGAEALFGYQSSEVFGKKFAKLLAGKSRRIMSEYLAALSGSGLAAIFNDGREVEAKVKQGGIVSLFLTIGLLETDRLKSGRIKSGISADGSAAFCVVVRDITQWKKTEEDLRQSKDRAEKSNARKSMFLANISHELRTPLNAIMGFSEVMRSERFGQIENEKYLSYANDIHASGGYLLALINDLLDLSKVEAGKLELNFTSVNLLNIIDEAMHSLKEQASDQRVIMRKSAAKNLPDVVADLRSMKQILLNLLSNAVKFSKKGDQVIISATLQSSGELLLTVKDTGRGMNNEELQRALEPFQRAEHSGDSDTQGTGLGLPLTKALVDANRARFTITSKPKKGTRVEIVFPITRVLAE